MSNFYNILSKIICEEENLPGGETQLNSLYDSKQQNFAKAFQIIKTLLGENVKDAGWISSTTIFPLARDAYVRQNATPLLNIYESFPVLDLLWYIVQNLESTPNPNILTLTSEQQVSSNEQPPNPNQTDNTSPEDVDKATLQELKKFLNYVTN